MKKILMMLLMVGMLIGAGGCGNVNPPSTKEIANIGRRIYPATADISALRSRTIKHRRPPCPDNYKDTVKNYVLSTMIVPESAMFRFEGEPFRQYQATLLSIGNDESNYLLYARRIRSMMFHWIIKVSINGRDKSGEFVGWQRRWYMIKNETIIAEGFVLSDIATGVDVLM